MGFISEVVPQVSAAAISRPAAPTSRAESAPQNPIASQPAAIVSLSTDSKSRSVSSGSNRYVDSSYGSEKYRTDKDSGKSNGKEKSTINVRA